MRTIIVAGLRLLRKMPTPARPRPRGQSAVMVRVRELADKGRRGATPIDQFLLVD